MEIVRRRVASTHWKRRLPTAASQPDGDRRTYLRPVDTGHLLFRAGEREAHSAFRAAFQRAVHRARVRDEVEPRPRMAREEFSRQQIALQAIAPRAGEDDVAGSVRAAVGERMNVVEGRRVEFEE